MLTQATIRRPIFQQPARHGENVLPAQAPEGTIDMIGAVMPFARNAEIYGENERVEHLYRVLKGSVRTYKVLRDGRRHIAAFYLPGDVFGFEAGDRHTLSAEAIADCQLLVLHRAAVAALAARDSSVAGQLWAMTVAELHRAQDQVVLVVRTAQERVAGFLLEMSKRSRNSDHINLPMSRQDIADYLGLTIETVSRALTQFKDAKAITLPTSRHIVLRDREALRRLNS
jgi:CRP/FNR family transcriptional regulator, nitrogen fixation regulation protein